MATFKLAIPHRNQVYNVPRLPVAQISTSETPMKKGKAHDRGWYQAPIEPSQPAFFSKDLLRHAPYREMRTSWNIARPFHANGRCSYTQSRPYQIKGTERSSVRCDREIITTDYVEQTEHIPAVAPERSLFGVSSSVAPLFV